MVPLSPAPRAMPERAAAYGMQVRLREVELRRPRMSSMGDMDYAAEGSWSHK